MHAETLLIWILIGAIAGWLASKIVRGGGMGLLGDIVVGVIGAFIGAWLLTQIGVTIAYGFIGTVASATLGAVLLLLAIRLIRRI